MNATISIICYKPKTLINGEHPLMIRISKDGKRKYKSVGVSVKPENWDFKKNRPKATCPNKDFILKIILDKEVEYQKQVLELKADNREFTASTLIETKAKKRVKSVSEYYVELIDELKSLNKIGNAKVYGDSFCSLKNFTNKKLDIPFSHIDMNFLKRYEKWLRQKNYAETSLSLLFRTLRSVYNKAIDEKHAKRNNYPFNDFRISKFNTKTAKRAISKPEIMKIMDMDLSNEDRYTQFSRDLFIFSYFCSGINFTDMANLKPNNIVNERLIYVRQKTAKRINIPLCEKAIEIISVYSEKAKATGYLFSILNENEHKTETQKYDRRKIVLYRVNRRLKKLSAKIGTDINLTTYVARHSYATVLKNSGVNIALIGETLGHSDLKTTQIYLDSFENSQIDEAMKNLL